VSTCPRSDSCGFFRAVQASLAKRLKYATLFPYCNTGGHHGCAIHNFLADGRTPPLDLLPNGGIDDYADTASAGNGMKVVVLDDSAVFAMFAANAVAATLPGASVVRCETYREAVDELAAPVPRRCERRSELRPAADAGHAPAVAVASRSTAR